MGEPSRKYGFLVKYTKPPSSDIPFEDIISTGWGDEFFEEDIVECFANYLVDDDF